MNLLCDRLLELANDTFYLIGSAVLQFMDCHWNTKVNVSPADTVNMNALHLCYFYYYLIIEWLRHVWGNESIFPAVLVESIIMFLKIFGTIHNNMWSLTALSSVCTSGTV
jgi:hypothetical protein